jgi:hypothetical protein
MSNHKSNLEAALKLAAKGFAVFPCQVGDKIPACEHGCLDASCDPARIRELWSNPLFNVAIATGKPSGVFVIDTDRRKGGGVSLQKLEAQFGPLPPTVKVITADGVHYYFKMPHGIDVRNSTGQIGVGIDCRGSGGYVLVPPSLHPSGVRYRWSDDCATEFAEASDWLLRKIIKPKTNSASAAAAPTNGDDWRSLIIKGAVPDGKRNDTLHRLAGLLFGFLPPSDALLAYELLRSVNQTHFKPPMDEAEFNTTVNSIAGMEINSRYGR